jgi:nucleotide-binding universal stress UspA family protein
VFAYDGSDLAKFAIGEAAALVGTEREALLVTVWQTFNVGFMPAAGPDFDAAQASEVRAAAERTASEGASLAESAGFRAEGLAVDAAPTWKGIVEVADARDASVIVLGSHSRGPITGAVLGSVAGAVAAHSRRSVLITHHRA